MNATTAPVLKNLPEDVRTWLNNLPSNPQEQYDQQRIEYIQKTQYTLKSLIMDGLGTENRKEQKM